MIVSSLRDGFIFISLLTIQRNESLMEFGAAQWIGSRWRGIFSKGNCPVQE